MSVYADYTAICGECDWWTHDRDETELGELHPRCPECGEIVETYVTTDNGGQPE